MREALLVLAMIIAVACTATAAPIPTDCSEVIRNIFASNVTDPVIPALGYEQITTLSGDNAVIVTVNITAAANAYGAGLDPATNRMRYISLPRPPCLTNITTTCVDDYFLAVDTEVCPLTDRFDADLGTLRFGAHVFFISGPEVPGCTGEAFTVQYDNVQFLNVDVNPYKFDLGGLLNGNTTSTPFEDYQQYRADTCPFVDGFDPGNFTTNVATCLGKVLTCSEPFTITDPPYVLEASARCKVDAGSTQKTVWRVQRVPEFRFDPSTVEYNATFGILGQEIVVPGREFPYARLLPNTRRQFEINELSPDIIQIGHLEAVGPRVQGRFSASPGYNKFLPPCVCNTTIFCDSGGNINVDVDGIPFTDPFAVPPPEPALQLVRRTISAEEFVLTTPFRNATGQPDLSLQYKWLEDPFVLSGGVTLVSSGDTAEETVQMPADAGRYFMYVYAFNGDETSSALIQIEIEELAVTAVIVAQPSNEIIVNTTCVLNATLSIPINTNPNIPNLTITSIEWQQLSGFNTPLTDDDTLTPSFVPMLHGELIYQLTLVDSNGNQDIEHVLIEVVDAPVPGSGAPVAPETNCTLNGGVCTASEAYCDFRGGVQSSFDCVSTGSSQSDLPGIGETFCCLLVNGTIPDAPIPGTIPSTPPDFNRPISSPPPPFSPVPPRARPLIPRGPTQTDAIVPGIGGIISDLLDNLQRGRALTTSDYIFYGIVFGIQTLLFLVIVLYVCSPEVSVENELAYYAILNGDGD